MSSIRGPRVAAPLLLAAAVLVFATGVAAEEAARKVLVPVYTIEPLPGVNGSSWATELWTSNWGNAVAGVHGLFWDCFLPQCGAAPLAPGVSLSSGLQSFDNLHGAFLSLDGAAAEFVGFGLRFRDLSRQATTAGTSLPMPRDPDFRSQKFSLLDIPLADGFRQTLRIYELDGTERSALVRVRLWRPRAARPDGEPDGLLGEATYPLQFSPTDLGVEKPGYAQITDLSTIAPLGDAETVRVEIEPVTEGLRLWAFVTVIHNETQHATVISPR